VFTVRLPITAVGPEAGGADAPPIVPEPGHPVTTLEGLRVLVVDDDAENREVVAATLESRDATVLTADSATQALALIEAQQVHVLLTDIGMPHEDGYTLIRRLRASSDASIAAIPAIALTAFARPDDRHHALVAGFQLHLAKPIEPETLVGAVATLARAHLAGSVPTRSSAIS